MIPYIFIISLISAFFFIPYVIRKAEEKTWNNGVCKENGIPWKFHSSGWFTTERTYTAGNISATFEYYRPRRDVQEEIAAEDIDKLSKYILSMPDSKKKKLIDKLLADQL